MPFDQLEKQYEMKTKSWEDLSEKIESQKEDENNEMIYFKVASCFLAAVLLGSQLKLSQNPFQEKPTYSIAAPDKPTKVIEKPVKSKNVRYFWVIAKQ